jgi:hypothetical protein
MALNFQICSHMDDSEETVHLPAQTVHKQLTMKLYHKDIKVETIDCGRNSISKVTADALVVQNFNLVCELMEQW